MGFTQYYYTDNASWSTLHMLLLCACGSKQILLNCIYMRPNKRSIPVINNKLNPIIVFPSGLTTKC